MLHVIIAESHEMFRLGLVNAIRELVGTAISPHQAADFEALTSLLIKHPDCHLAVIDWNLRAMRKFEGIARVRALNPLVPVLVLGASENTEDIKNAFRLNVAGYVPRSASAAVLCSAVSVVLAGGIFVPSQVLIELLDGKDKKVQPTNVNDGTLPTAETFKGLTARQSEVVRELSTGKSNKRIARAMGITEGTVKLHLAAIYRALGVRNRTEAVLTATRTQKDLDQLRSR